MLDDQPTTQEPGAPISSRQAVRQGPAVHVATAVDTKRCMRLISLAFENDPPSRWVWPGLNQYTQAFPLFAEAFGGGAIDHGTAQYVENFTAVALWLPPGVAPQEESLVRVIFETVSQDRRDAVFSLFEQMDRYHPCEPHWHLPLIGVHPKRQGLGIGSTLMRRTLARCDREDTLAYLEATSPRNVPLYERLGFERLGSIQVADSPPIVPMLRKPR